MRLKILLRVLIYISLFSCMAGAQKSSITVTAPSDPPQLFFACCDGKDMHTEFEAPSLIPDLQELHAGIALQIADFSPERAQIVRRLNEANVPVIAWLVLSKEEGLYLNADNEPQAAARFTEFEKWSAQYQLKWKEIGLDIEPNFQALSRASKARLLLTLAGNYFDWSRVQRAKEQYGSLIAQMHAHGYQVQTHQLMYLADEREAHTTVLERLFGIVDVKSDDEVLMLYSSFNHSAGAGLVWSYGPAAQTIAVGSTATSGDPATDAKFPPLSPQETLRDLRVASHFSRLVGVYSLEGCLRQNMLPQLKTMRWDEPVTITQESLTQADHAQKGARLIVRTLKYLPVIVFLFCLAVYCMVSRWRRRRRLKRLAAATA